MENLYETLGVEEDASKEEIKKAYKGKAMILHPDRNNGQDKGFSGLKKAYEVLSDEDRRKKYDETGDTENEPKSEDKVRDGLIQLFNVMLDTQENYKTADLVKIGVENLNNGIQRLRSDVRKLEANIQKLSKARNRMKKKDKRPNLFESLIDDRERMINKNINQINIGIDIHLKLIDELSTYEYFHEESEEISGFSFAVSGFSDSAGYSR